MNSDRIRQAVRETIKENPQRLKGEAIAARMGIATSSLYRWGEPGEQTIPLDRLVQLVLITGDIRPIQALCSTVGGHYIPRRPASAVVSGELASVRAVKEFSDVLNDYSTALLDGRVSVKENARIQRDGAEAMQAIAELLELARESAEGTRG